MNDKGHPASKSRALQPEGTSEIFHPQESTVRFGFSDLQALIPEYTLPHFRREMRRDMPSASGTVFRVPQHARILMVSKNIRRPLKRSNDSWQTLSKTKI